jgi:CRP-like cAMP-binding protein
MGYVATQVARWHGWHGLTRRTRHGALLALNLKRERGLSEVIVELDSVAIPQARIAELLGTSAGYVSVALARAKKDKTGTDTDE